VGILNGDGNGNGQTVRLTIPAKAEYIMLGRLALTSLSRLRALSPEQLSDVKLALTEACTNAVQHAYDAEDGFVEILYELHPDRLVIEVTDTGDGFVTPDSVPDPEDLTEGGLGIAIIRALSDEFEVGDREGGGSRLRFVKLLG
jgi:serine/threonine-protein kinase RsbW